MIQLIGKILGLENNITTPFTIRINLHPCQNIAGEVGPFSETFILCKPNIRSILVLLDNEPFQNEKATEKCNFSVAQFFVS